jgi:hypothetical protein
MSENLFFCTKIVSEKPDFNRQIGDLCFKPLRYLFNGRTVKLLNGVVHSETPAVQRKSFPKNARFSAFIYPQYRLGGHSQNASLKSLNWNRQAPL